MRQLRKHTKPIIGGIGLIILIALAVLIMLAPTGAIMTNEQPATAVSQTASYIPNPIMTTNATWTSFNSSWSELEYTNGTSNLTLNAEPSQEYLNPITVNPADIQSKAFKAPLGTSGIEWNKTFNEYGGATATTTVGKAKLNIQSESSNTSLIQSKTYWNISTAYIPYTNPAYDYATLIFSSIQTGTGNTYIDVGIGNGTTEAGLTGLTYGTSTNETATISGGLQTTGTVFISMQASQYVKNFNSGYMQIGISQNLPETTTAGAVTVNTTILGVMLTSYQVSLGTFTNSTGQHSITAMETADGQDTASNLNPNFAWSSITNNGYTVAISQPLQNTTESQTSISSGSYIEQVTYQGSFSLPTAPDLTYSNSVIQMNLTTPGSQYEVANLNGISYLSNLQTKDNGTFVFDTVNPNQANSLILEVEFTAAQWNASTVAPSFFSIQGIEYYWWVGIIGLLSIVGLGAAASSHFSGEEENLKVPKGKFGR